MAPQGTRLLLALAVLAAAVDARAATYPWVDVAADDVRVMTTAQMDLAVRLEIIRRAERTLDVVVFEQMADPDVGLPILSAIRDAANRGVRVRFVTCWIAQVVKDKKNLSGKYLLNPPTRAPIDFIIFGGKKQKHGKWDLADSVHEKLIIADDSVVLATGRGHSNSYVNWLDTSFLIGGPLVAQSVDAFERIWAAVRVEHDPMIGNPRAPEPPRHDVLPSMRIASSELAELDAHVQVVERKMAGTSEAGASPARGRILHFDMIRQYQEMGYRIRRGVYGRARAYTDPIVDAVLARLPSARSVRYSTLSVLPHPVLREALIEAAQRGVEVHIQANGEGAALDPLNAPFYSSLWDIRRMFREGRGRIHVHGLEPGRAHPWTYTHRKMAVIEDASGDPSRDAVIFGSHNLNIGSSSYNDELSYEVEGGSFAAEYRAIFDRDLQLSSPELTDAQVGKYMLSPLAVFGRLLGSHTLGFM